MLRFWNGRDYLWHSRNSFKSELRTLVPFSLPYSSSTCDTNPNPRASIRRHLNNSLHRRHLWDAGSWISETRRMGAKQKGVERVGREFDGVSGESFKPRFPCCRKTGHHGRSPLPVISTSSPHVSCARYTVTNHDLPCCSAERKRNDRCYSSFSFFAAAGG